MRARLAKLAVFTGASALVITGTLGAVPAANADPVESNLIVNIVDTTGAATKGTVMLVPVSDSDIEDPINLSVVSGGDDSEPYPILSTYQAAVPPGDYAVLAVTGWGGTICLGISPCSLTAFLGAPGTTAPTLTSGVTVPELGSGIKTLTITSELPVLRGDGSVGRPLTVDFPSGFDELQKLLKVYLTGYSEGLFGGIDLAPTVEWMRGGTPIDDASGTTYRPTGADVGAPVSAKLNYNLLLASFLSSGGGPFGLPFGGEGGSTFPIPDAFTTNAITAKKVATAIKVRVPSKVKQGARANALVSATAGGSPVTGWAKVRVPGGGSTLVMMRKGYAQVKLAKLKPGKHKVTATLLATEVYTASTAADRLVVKKHKKPKK